jgi:hypothetical protein
MINPAWLYSFRFYRHGMHCIVYRDDTLRVQLQVVTRTAWYAVRKKRTYYFVDGVKRVFRTEQKMLRALGRREHLHVRPVRPAASLTTEPGKLFWRKASLSGI